jgi:chromate transporter
MGLVCFRIAILTFGTGMVVLPLLQQSFVESRHWVDPQAFAQALALGQVTPGPVVITATALGHSALGVPGALACTLGIFLPSFLNTLILVPGVERRLGDRGRLEAFIRGAMPWIVGAIAAAAVRLPLPAFLRLDWIRISVFSLTLAAGALHFRRGRVPAWILIPLGGLVSLLLERGYNIISQDL